MAEKTPTPKVFGFRGSFKVFASVDETVCNLYLRQAAKHRNRMYQFGMAIMQALTLPATRRNPVWVVAERRQDRHDAAVIVNSTVWDAYEQDALNDLPEDCDREKGWRPDIVDINELINDEAVYNQAKLSPLLIVENCDDYGNLWYDNAENADGMATLFALCKERREKGLSTVCTSTRPIVRCHKLVDLDHIPALEVRDFTEVRI